MFTITSLQIPASSHMIGQKKYDAKENGNNPFNKIWANLPSDLDINLKSDLWDLYVLVIFFFFVWTDIPNKRY